MAEGRSLQIITRLSVGGASRAVLLTSEALRHLGWDVEIAAGPSPETEGDLAHEADARGVPLRAVPDLQREHRPWQDWRAYGALRDLIRSGGYQVVHTHTSKAGILGRHAARRAGTPAIFHTVHGWPFDQVSSWWARPVYTWLERRAAPWCQRLIMVSERDRRTAEALHIGCPERHEVLPPPFDVELFERAAGARQAKRAELGVAEGVPVVGTVTRMALAKAPLDFVAVGERLLAAHPEVVVLMIGDGPLMPEVQRRVEELGSARLRLLGLRHDVPELMAALDVFVLASRSEGSPLVLREAMALRKAIVATDVGGVSESVEDGATGFIVPAGDVEALARRTLELVRDPARAERLGESGHARVRPRFCPDWVAGRLGQLYRECLETTEARGKT